MTHAIERLRNRYRPADVRLLFVGESAPASGQFFYRGQTAITRYTRQAFERAFSRRFVDDEEFLAFFQSSGCWLDDVVLHCAKQVWVHVDFHNYRSAYKTSLPNEDVSGLVIDHVMNRRVARVKGFAYVRLVAITRGANSSSGGLCEKWQVAYHSSEQMREVNRKSQASIQYADLADLVKMLDMKTGNSIQGRVNSAQALVRPPGGNPVPGAM